MRPDNNNIGKMVEALAQNCKRRSGSFDICVDKGQPCKRVIEQGECPALSELFKNKK